MFGWLKRNPTFRQIAEEWLSGREGYWTNGVKRYNRQWFDRHIYPYFGDMQIHKITVDHIRTMITTYSRKAPTQARRILGKVIHVFDYAIACGWCKYNPAAGLRVILPAPPIKGFSFVPIKDMPDLMAAIETHPYSNEAAVCAFWLVVYTAVRRGEAAFACVDEFDFEQNVWVIKSERMKKRREHLVPLSPQVVALLQAWLKRRKQLGMDNDNRIGGVRGVYNKALLLDERRQLMNWYADEVDRWRNKINDDT